MFSYLTIQICICKCSVLLIRLSVSRSVTVIKVACCGDTGRHKLFAVFVILVMVVCDLFTTIVFIVLIIFFLKLSMLDCILFCIFNKVHVNLHTSCRSSPVNCHCIDRQLHPHTKYHSNHNHVLNSNLVLNSNHDRKPNPNLKSNTNPDPKF